MTAASQRIAVLPFKASAGDADAAAIAEGLTEDVMGGLLKFPHLLVTRDLVGARYHLDGSVRKAGASVRVKAQLVDVQTGAQVWAETYARDLETLDIFALQDDVTDCLVATVGDGYGVVVQTMATTLHATRRARRCGGSKRCSPRSATSPSCSRRRSAGTGRVSMPSRTTSRIVRP